MIAKQLTDLQHNIFEQKFISKIKCWYPSIFDPLLLAWDNVPLSEQTLLPFQTRLIKFQGKLHERDAPIDKPYFIMTTPTHAKPSPLVDQKKDIADCHARYMKYARCYQCGHRGHFGKKYSNGYDSSTPTSPKHMIHAHKEPRHHKHDSSPKKQKQLYTHHY